jgi:hypothetical protein
MYEVAKVVDAIGKGLCIGNQLATGVTPRDDAIIEVDVVVTSVHEAGSLHEEGEVFNLVRQHIAARPVVAHQVAVQRVPPAQMSSVGVGSSNRMTGDVLVVASFCWQQQQEGSEAYVMVAFTC